MSISVPEPNNKILVNCIRGECVAIENACSWHNIYRLSCFLLTHFICSVTIYEIIVSLLDCL